MEPHLPIRCRAEEVAEQLRLVVGGLPFLADRSWEEVGWGRMRIELLSLWRVELLLEPGSKATTTPGSWRDVALSLVTWAGAPDGRCWEYGCQRDDWTLGPASRLVEPLHARCQLRWRLASITLAGRSPQPPAMAGGWAALGSGPVGG